MKGNTSIVILCLSVLISLVGVSATYAESSKAFDKMSQAEKDKKYQQYMNQLQEQMRRAQSGKPMSASPKEMKAQQTASEFLRKYAQDMQKKAYSNSRSSNPVKSDNLRIERERMRKQQQVRAAYSKRKNDVIAGRWINSKGINLNFSPTGFVNFSGYKSMSWTRKNSAISFYLRGSKGKEKGARSPITGLYNKNKDSITLTGTKYADATFIRANTAKGRSSMMAAHNAQQLSIIQAKEKKYKEKLKAKKESGRYTVDETWKSKTGPNIKGLKLAKEFEKTLSCKNCDLTSLKDHIFDCHWCEAEGSNFSKKNKLWSRYEFKWATLKNSNFSSTSIRNTSFYKADLRGADFSGARIGQSNFAYANLEGANFRNAQIGESLFNGANLKNADFTGARIIRTDFSFADIKEKILKSASLDDVKVKATSLDKKFLGVWHSTPRAGQRGTFYYEFFEDGSQILANDSAKRLWAVNPMHRKFGQQSFYSIRKGAFEKMSPTSRFRDSDRHSKNIPKIQGDKLVFTKPNSNTKTIYTRTRGAALTKYIKFRNTRLALRSAYLWNTDVIEKLSSSGVNYATLYDSYGKNIFEHMFESFPRGKMTPWYNRVVFDRHARYIFTTLLRTNKEFASGSRFEEMLLLSLKSSYEDTVKYLLSQATNKDDMKFALIKYKKIRANTNTSKFVSLLEKRISEL